MTKLQNQNLSIGLGILAVDVILFIILGSMEGNIVIRNGQEYVYSVDAKVYLIMLLIAVIGVTIVLLTVVEYRKQSSPGRNDVNDIDMNRRKSEEPDQTMTEKPTKDERPEWKKRKDRAREKRKELETADQIGSRSDRLKVPEPMLVKIVPVTMNDPEPIPAMEPVTAKVSELIRTNGQTINKAEKEPAKADEPRPVQRIAPKAIPRAELAKSAKFIPVRVEAIGRCPMCGKVIVLDQAECFKCGWKVIPKKLVPLPEPDSDADD